MKQSAFVQQRHGSPKTTEVVLVVMARGEKQVVGYQVLELHLLWRERMVRLVSGEGNEDVEAGLRVRLHGGDHLLGVIEAPVLIEGTGVVNLRNLIERPGAAGVADNQIGEPIFLFDRLPGVE